MELREIHDQHAWDGFVSTQPFASFPQSWAWGEFQRTLGKSVMRFQWVEKGAIKAAIQLIREKRRLTGYWFAPRGPIFANQAKPHLRQQFEKILRDLLAKKLHHGSLFLRFEPMVEHRAAEGMMPLRMRRNHALNPAATRLIHLENTEETLLAEMHQKTRYNIRLAAKHGVTIRESQSDADLETFLALTQETATRDQFTSHSRNYLKATFDHLKKAGLAKLRLAEHAGVVLAANMEIWFGDTVTYLHGASSNHNRNLMAPFLLQWEAMRAAKQQGKKLYDLWGCNPAARSSHYYKESWEGISRFKSGFGGELRHFIGTWDMPVYRTIYRLAFPHQWRG